MKVGLCTPYKVDNYGTKLQAYAVQVKIKSLGYEVEIVNFDRRSDHRFVKLLKRYANKEYLQGKLRKKTDARKNSALMRVNLIVRKDAINSFDKSHYKLTPLIKGYHELCHCAEQYDAVICGSDQIWLPGSINNPTTTLEFAPKNCKRIAFAPSFGISNVPDNRKKEYAKFLKEFDALSVREVQGAENVKELTGMDVPVVLDPTLSVEPSVWSKLADEGRSRVQEPYMFCYFLGRTEQHRTEARKIADRLGLKLVIMPHFKEYVPADEACADVCLYDVTPSDFVRMIRDASYVCTDSFHATVFSILNHKRFMTFERFKSTSVNSANSRIYSLLGQLNLLEHIWSEKTTAIQEDTLPNYSEVERILLDLRKKTTEYLQNALKDVPKEEQVQVALHKKKQADCCGCGACASVCQKKCIEMQPEEGTGFYYPRLVRPEACIHCNQCNAVCPNEQPRNVCHSVAESYCVVNRDPEILSESSSGGVFYPLAMQTLGAGGYVCAAIYNEKFEVCHTIIHTEAELKPLVGSKYAESNLGDCFERIQQLLKADQKVLFCGTPCQAHGLCSYLKKDYQNLFVVDLLCYGIQSPKAWEKYKEFIVPEGKKICAVNMRDKSDSWQNYSIKIDFGDSTSYVADKQTDLYAKTYSKGYFIRPACYSCDLKAFPRKSDVTIGDFWDIDKIMPEKNDGHGTGILFPQTEKGMEAIRVLEQEGTIECLKIDADTLRQVHPLFCLNAKKNRKSEKFMSMLKEDNTSFDTIVEACKQGRTEIILRSIYRKIKRR